LPRLASDWITLSEAAEIFGSANVPISRSTLARWAASGKLQSIRPGRRIFVRRAQVRHLLQPRRLGVPAASLQPGLFEEWES
jgi:excisionase family DNA binding protein